VLSLRKRWLALFVGVIVLELVLIGFGVMMGTGGQNLASDAAKRLEAMAQIFQTIAALAVIGCITVGRSRLTAEVVQSPEHLMRETMLCMAIGEMGVLLALVGLAKFHLPEFLVAAGLVLAVDFGFVLPRCLKLIGGLTNKKL